MYNTHSRLTDPSTLLFTHKLYTQQTVFIIFAGVLLLVDILFSDFQFVFDPDPNVRGCSGFGWFGGLVVCLLG